MYLLKDINLLEKSSEKRATKFILNDSTSDYKSRLSSLHILPLMYFFELTDLMFFIKSIKNPADHFNIKDFISFSGSNTRSTSHHKLLHSKVSTNYSRHFYFHHISRLWNSLPPINLDASLFTIKSNLVKHLWAHFDSHFNSVHSTTFVHVIHATTRTIYPTSPNDFLRLSADLAVMPLVQPVYHLKFLFFS